MRPLGFAWLQCRESGDRNTVRKLLEERRQFDLFREELQVLALQWSAQALDQSLFKLEPCRDALQKRVKGELRATFRVALAPHEIVFEMPEPSAPSPVFVSFLIQILPSLIPGKHPEISCRAPSSASHNR